MIHTLQKVSALIQEALNLLDDAGAPADIGAHLDLGLSRIEDLLGLPERQISAAVDSQSIGHAGSAPRAR